MTKMMTKLSVLVLALSFALPASARDNDRYGQTLWEKLPLNGMISKNIWVGSWWAYRSDGLSYRLHDDSVSSFNYKTDWSRWDSKDTEDLSPAEKIDLLLGRMDKIDYENLIEKAKKVQELDSAMTDKIDRRRTLIRNLNTAIRENSEDPAFRWEETDDGKEYLELKEEIDKDQETIDAFEVDVDTAHEYEVLSHGTLQFGVQSWFGHCNAWAAAAILQPEPRQATTVDNIRFTAGDVKAYLTENHMEIQSSFFGSRNDFHETEEAREAVDFQDMTPAGFHILFADMVGNKDESFVIDRFTGDEVWNQPVKAYRSKVEALYENNEPLKRQVKYTEYGWQGAEVQERGEQEVFPVLVTTTIHWITDGLPHEVLTVTNISNDIDDETFSSASRIGDLYDHQVEMRTLTYELWLDAPMDDPQARIIGDGVWDHGAASGFTALHPDFVWKPLADVNNRGRDYENEFIPADLILDRILPGTLEPQDDPNVPLGAYPVTGSVAIPDNDRSNPAVMTVDVPDDITINTLEVDVDITHTYIGDLQVRLKAPSGKTKVIKRFGAGRSDNDIKRTFDVKAFNGQNARGTWELIVRDQWKNDTGTVNGFTLHIK